MEPHIEKLIKNLPEHTTPAGFFVYLYISFCSVDRHSAKRYNSHIKKYINITA